MRGRFGGHRGEGEPSRSGGMGVTPGVVFASVVGGALLANVVVKDPAPAGGWGSPLLFMSATRVTAATAAEAESRSLTGV